MSVLKKFWKWLRGEPSPTKTNIKIKLRILERRLERHEMELRERRKKEIIRIREALRSGNIDLAREHAKQAILLDRGLISATRIRSLVSTFRGYIERGEIIKDLADSIKELAPNITQVATMVGDKELMEAFSELAKTSEKIASTEELFTETLGEISESDLDESAEKLVEKIAEREGIKIPKKKEVKVKEDEIERILKEVLKEE
ncbi:MAG: hypothetical protein ACTSX9_01905 [Candidatus Njordarchaeales archaeon]